MKSDFSSSLQLVCAVFWLSLCACAGIPEKVSPEAAAPTAELKIGLALGSGGANGLAHIAILEVFDEMGITPHRMAGTSIGSIIGALYASGKSAAEIKTLVEDLVVQETDTWQEVLLERHILEWLRFVDPDIGNGGLLSGDAFVAFLHEAMNVSTFEELQIPLIVVTTDLWKREQVLHRAGDLFAPIQASMAIPGLFSPVTIDGRVLVDGGLVNPVPYDLLFDDCDLVIAVSVIGKTIPKDEISFLDTTFLTMRIMQTSILAEKRAHREPDIFIDTNIYDVRTLEYHKLDSIYQQAQSAKQELRSRLLQIMPQ